MSTIRIRTATTDTVVNLTMLKKKAASWLFVCCLHWVHIQGKIKYSSVPPQGPAQTLVLFINHPRWHKCVLMINDIKVQPTHWTFFIESVSRHRSPMPPCTISPYIPLIPQIYHPHPGEGGMLLFTFAIQLYKLLRAKHLLYSKLYMGTSLQGVTQCVGMHRWWWWMVFIRYLWDTMGSQVFTVVYGYMFVQNNSLHLLDWGL